MVGLFFVMRTDGRIIAVNINWTLKINTCTVFMSCIYMCIGNKRTSCACYSAGMP